MPYIIMVIGENDNKQHCCRYVSYNKNDQALMLVQSLAHEVEIYSRRDIAETDARRILENKVFENQKATICELKLEVVKTFSLNKD